MITKELVIEACKAYEDPELGIDVWTLGLIYDIQIEKNDVKIKLTFTSPMCPFGPQMVEDIKNKVKENGAENVDIIVNLEDIPWISSFNVFKTIGQGNIMTVENNSDAMAIITLSTLLTIIILMGLYSSANINE